MIPFSLGTRLSSGIKYRLGRAATPLSFITGPMSTIGAISLMGFALGPGCHELMAALRHNDDAEMSSMMTEGGESG